MPLFLPSSSPSFWRIVQFQKISILPPKKGLEFPGGRGFCKAKKFKEMCEALLKFPEGWGRVLEKIPSVGEAWIFSGTTHCANFIESNVLDIADKITNYYMCKHFSYLQNNLTGYFTPRSAINKGSICWILLFKT